MSEIRLYILKKLRLFVFCLGILLVMSFSAKAQDNGKSENNNCLTLNELIGICRNPASSTGQLMKSKQFLMVSDEENVDYVFHDDTLKLRLFSCQSSDGFNNVYINIFIKEGCRNIVEFNASAYCANGILEECRKTMSENPREEGGGQSFVLDDSLIVDFSEFSEDDAYVLITCYDPFLMERLASQNKSRQQQLEEERERKRGVVLQGLQVADSLAQLEYYESAIEQLEAIYNLLPEYTLQIDKKLGAVKNQFKEKKIRTYTEEGERFYASGDYVNALDRYLKVLSEDVNDANARERSQLIRRKLEILNNRNQIVYPYYEINLENYNDFKLSLSSEINQLVSVFDEGRLKMDYHIGFDTAMVNQSFYEIIDFRTVEKERNLKFFNDQMSRLLGHRSLQPTYREEIPVASSSVFNIDLSWNSFHQQIVKNRKKIVNKSSFSIDNQIYQRITRDTTWYYGKYFFDVKEKHNGDKIYKDIKLVKYKTVGGEAFFYGLIPGLGTLLATQGKEGAACMSISLVCYAGAAATYILFKQVDKKMKAAGLDEETLQQKAQAGTLTDEEKKMKTEHDAYKWSSIASVSIGGVVQFSGMIKAMVRGIQNKKASRQLRKALKKDPIEISKEEVEF